MAILAAVGDEQTTDVLQEAATLARAFEESLVVLHVMSENEFEERAEERPEYTIETAETNAKQTASNAAREVAERVPELEAVGRVGSPGNSVVDEANERDVRYIVVGGRKRSPSGKAVFGSTTQKIILNSSRPVLTVLRK